MNVDGKTEVVAFTNATCYKTLNEGVNGYIQCVRLHHLNVDMWVNEEGKLRDLPTNDQATLMWVRSYGPTDVIKGNVVFTSHTNSMGNTVGLSDEQIEKIKKEIIDFLKVTIISLDDIVEL